MHLEHDDFLEQCDEIADTLAAARAAAEHLAAAHLSFGSQVRVHRRSTHGARAWVRAHTDITALPTLPGMPDASAILAQEDGTDEVLLRALGAKHPAPQEFMTEEYPHHSAMDASSLPEVDTDSGEDVGAPGDALIIFDEDVEVWQEDEDPSPASRDADLGQAVTFIDEGEATDSHVSDRAPTPVGPPARGDRLPAAVTMSDEDFDHPAEPAEIVLDEDTEADSATGPIKTRGAAVRVGKKKPPAETEAPSRKEALPSYSPAVAKVPIVADRTPSPRAAKPAAAAIQLQPGGGAKVLHEPIELELGEADGDFEDDGVGFSIQVEEVLHPDAEEESAEYNDVDDADFVEHLEPDPESIDLPSMSADELHRTLSRAAEAAQRGDHQTAIQLYSDALDFDPDNVSACVGRGLAWLDLGDYARSMSDFSIASDLAPHDAAVNSAFGKLYYDRKDYGRAVDYLDRAISADPTQAMAWCRRGISHYYRKDYTRALEDLQHAEKLDKYIPNIGTYINMVRKRLR